LLVTRSDFLAAIAVRQSAQQVCAKYGRGQSELFFQGHWGFQYYMDLLGASAFDVKHSKLQPGDHLAVPSNNTSLYAINPELLALQENLTVSGPNWLATWNTSAGAGFYAASLGPLPFAFGRIPPENVTIYLLKPTAPPKVTASQL
ncbi:MAG TPA: hypothetical protein VMD57_05385, partial [Candidatus Baltobacteraceae bacterium]|nr:hypothetical protein [Candidatus Baltobacteraceae bacterium]